MTQFLQLLWIGNVIFALFGFIFSVVLLGAMLSEKVEAQRDGRQRGFNGYDYVAIGFAVVMGTTSVSLVSTKLSINYAILVTCAVVVIALTDFDKSKVRRVKLKPQTLSDFLLELVAGAKAAEVLIADLREMYPIRRKKYGNIGAQAWYIGQVLRAIISYIPPALKKLTGLAALLEVVHKLRQ